MELNNIPNNTNWGKASSGVNENFQKIEVAIEKLEGATTKFKGYFATPALLEIAFPSPKPGESAWAGSPYPGTVYECRVAGTWQDTGVVPEGPTVDLVGYVTEVYLTETLADYVTTETLVELLKEERKAILEGVKELTKDFITGTQADKKISDATKDFVTGNVVNDQITDATKDLATKEEVTEEITEATKDFETKENVTKLTDISLAEGNTLERKEDGLFVNVPEIEQEDGALVNVTESYPPQSGYYTLDTAIAAIPEDKRRLGLVITFAVTDDAWKSYQYSGSVITPEAWVTAGIWNEYGGGGSVKSITSNGQTFTPNEEGNIHLPIQEIEVDETLDTASTNPIENQAVASAIQDVNAHTVFIIESEVDEETNNVKLTLKNKSGAVIDSTEFQGGTGTGGGGGESPTATKVVLNTSVDKPIVKEGDSAILTYFYDHQYTSGDDRGTSTGQKGTIEITMKRGNMLVHSQTINDVSTGAYQLDLTKYLLSGTTDIYVNATTTDPESGKVQTKQSYTSVKVVTLSLSSTYNIASPVSGYDSSSNATIPFTVSGTGTKVITLYVDGMQRDTRTVSKAGQTNGSFSVSMSGLLPGRHTIQMVAEMEASETLTIRSESVYFDIYKTGTGLPHICTKHSFKDGRIFDDTEHLTPLLEIGQYEKLAFDMLTYDPTQTPANVDVYNSGIKTQTVSVPRTTQEYTNRYTEQGIYEMKFVCGKTQYPFFVDVVQSSIDIEEVSADLSMKLSASGRSNSEENPAVWTDGEVTTQFSGFDWSSNGWDGDALNLTNGASIEVEKKVFSTDAMAVGATYEFELKCSNPTDKNGIILSCLSDGVGFQMTTQEALLYASGGSSVGTKFASDIDLKIAFVVGRKSGHRMLELYVNGVSSGSKQYAQSESMLQDSPVNITISSDAADVSIRTIRIYNRALTDDEELNNYIVDRPTSEEMVTIFQRNDVMNDEGTSVDVDKLLAQGKNVMIIKGDVNLVNETNNKKFEVPADVYFYSKYGREYDFVAKQIGLRIQGTSSTTYPRKNYRLYFLRSDKYNTELYVNGVLVPDLKYSFKPGARRVSIFCLKADFSDSSSTHNTGAVRLINDIWKKCGFLTPPQEVDQSVRIGVDGDPIDLFYDNDGTGINIYLGKYNFNNEKSESHEVYGFEGIKGFNDEEALGGNRNKCVCLEFLNNSHPLCLFGTSNISEENFDDGLEFRFKADKTWKDADQEDKDSILRLWRWVDSVKDDSERFRAECAEYFNVNSLFAWYVITDYLMAVDSRAKNMMLVTWDGIHWYFIPYDLDTILGGRNDSYLAYDYTITWETFDESIGSYAMAGHDSVLWKLVRTWPEKLQEVANTIRSNMSTEDVLRMFNVTMMGNWSERIYNKDGDYKYKQPLTEGVVTSEGIKYYDYLYALQGNRYAHRTYTIQNRFALLDSQYLAGTYRQDSFPIYFSYKFSQDNRLVYVTASERYYFGYGYTSGEPKQSGVLAEDAGSTISLKLDTDLIINDPQYFYGASRMQGIDLTKVSHAIVGTLNLNNCVALRKLDISCAITQKTMNALLLNRCRHLRELNVSGLKGENFVSLDLSNNTKLERLKAGNSALTGVSFASGSPLSSVTLPDTLQSLELSHLNKLTNKNLVLEGTNNINRLVVDGCELIDWQALLALCSSTRYLRVKDVKIEGDGALLRQLLSMGGVDENGANTSTCRLVGEYRLTSSITEEEYEVLSTHFPELRITQPEYTMIEFDDDVADDRNVSNLDNKTGYKYGNDYVPSGHIVKILNSRFGCLGKQAEEGNMSICKLHDENFHYYADADKVENASEAKLDSTEGDVFIYEPKYWRKGINDYLNEKKYSCYSSNAEMPPVPEATIVTLDEIISKSRYINKYKLISGFSTVSEAYSSDANYSVCQIEVEKHKRVRFPTVLGTSSVCSVFTNEEGNVVEEVSVPITGNGFENGMYLIKNVPENAKYLYFSIWNNADWDNVVLSNSDKIEDMEPDWVFTDECLVGAFQANTIGKLLYSAAVGSARGQSGLSYNTFNVYAKARNLQISDYEMSNNIANLFFAKYGRKNSQDQCGYGYGSTITEMGITAFLGMKDTVNQEGAKVYSYYENKDQLGNTILVRIAKEKVMGYEGWISENYEFLSGVEIPNTPSAEAYKFYITMPDGKVRKVKSSSTSGFITGIVHQKYMDAIKAGSGIGGSGTTYYCDSFAYSGSINRSLLRKGYYNDDTAGVISLYYSYDKESENNAFGIRIAFRGKITLINSVNQFKNIAAKW